MEFAELRQDRADGVEVAAAVQVGGGEEGLAGARHDRDDPRALRRIAHRRRFDDVEGEQRGGVLDERLAVGLGRAVDAQAFERPHGGDRDGLHQGAVPGADERHFVGVGLGEPARRQARDRRSAQLPQERRLDDREQLARVRVEQFEDRVGALFGVGPGLEADVAVVRKHRAERVHRTSVTPGAERLGDVLRLAAALHRKTRLECFDRILEADELRDLGAGDP